MPLERRWMATRSTLARSQRPGEAVGTAVEVTFNVDTVIDNFLVGDRRMFRISRENRSEGRALA